MDTQRVEVFHACHCKAVVVCITDYLELNFFPTFQRLFYQNLFRESEGAFSQFQELFLILTDTAAQTTQCVSRSNHNREANAFSSRNSIFHALYSLADRSLHLDLVQFLHEEVTVFRIHDSFYRSTQYAYTIFIQDTTCVQLSTAVQGSLTTESQQDTIRLFLLDDFFYEISSYRQEINLICDTFRSLDSRNVRVYQY